MRHLFTTLLNLVSRKQEHKLDMVWYDGTKPTKERIAELRYKLGVARGALGAVIDGMEELNMHGIGGEIYTDIITIREAMKDSID